MSGINEQVINAEIYQIGPQGIPGEAATISVGTVTTGEPGTDASVTNSGTSSAAILDFVIPQGEQGLQGIQGPQGIQGLTGATGNGISSIEKIATVGLTDTYRITFTNNTYYDFEVINGSSISDIEKTNTSGLVDTYTITLTNGNTHTFTVTNGAKGDKGETGEVGNGILGVNKMSTTGLVDNYRMTFTNGTYFDFDVTNAKSIVSIAKTSTSGLVDTYRITFNDGSNFQFPVTNGNGVSGVTLLSWVGLDKTYRMTFTNGTYFDFVVSNGAEGQAEWGGISGVLSNQHDLQDALDAKANVSQTHALKAYSDNGEILTDAEGLTDVKKYAHSTFDRSKFTVVGSPVITDDGIASGFTTSKFITVLSNNKISHTGHIVEYCYRNLDIVSLTEYPIFGTVRCTTATSYINVSFGVTKDNGNLLVTGSGEGGAQTYITMPFATFYQNPFDFKISFNGTTLSLSIYQNGELKSSQSATLLATPLESYIHLGCQQFNNAGERYNAWTSSIDLKQLSITVDGVEVFSGNKTGIDTIKPDNYTVVGTPTISDDGVASGFSRSNRISTGALSQNISGTNWEIHLKVHTLASPSTAIIGTEADGNTARKSLQIGMFNGVVWTYLGNGTTGQRYGTSGGVLDADMLIVVGRDGTNYYTKLYDVNGNLLNSKTETVQYDVNISSISYIGGSDSSWTGSIDLNSFKIYVDGNLVYQPCLKIPYTQSKTGSKIVNAVYRDRVNDMAEQFGYANYYTLSDTDFTLPQVELYGLIGNKTLRDSYYNGVTYWELFSNRRLEQGGSCESGVEYTLPKPFADANYVLTIPYSSKTATSFIPSATGDFIAKGTGLL